MWKDQVLSEPVVPYEERRRRIEADPLPENIGALIDKAAEAAGDQLLWNFFDSGETITYAQMRRQVNGLAAAFVALGIRKGTHVGVMLPNIAAFPLTWLALGRIGAVMLPINPGYRPREIEHVTKVAEAEWIVTHADTRATLDQAHTEGLVNFPPEKMLVVGGEVPKGAHDWQVLTSSPADSFTAPDPVGHDDLLNIQFTSGTTGFPKGCMLSQRYWISAGKVNAFRDGRRYRRLLASTPFFYMDPQWLLLMTLFQRGTLFVAAKQSTSRFSGWLKEFDIEFCLLPWVLHGMEPQAHDADNRIIRANIYGCPKGLHEGLEQRFDLNAREAFGMTELGPSMFVPIERADKVGSGSCGVPCPFRECRIVGEDGQPVPPGEVGELQLRGPGIMLGYYNNPKATAEVLKDGWFSTGDLFRQDGDGFYYIVGRKKDMIRRSAENIAAREVETVLAAAMGVPGMARAQGAPVQGGVLRIGQPNASQNDNLDPGTWSTSWTGTSFNGGIYNNLVEILPDGSVGADLAESWEPETGAAVWRFKIRQGIKFHDGRDLTLEDIRQSFLHHMKEGSTSAALAIVKQISQIDIEGTDTVIFTLTDGNADFPFLLSDYHLSILPALEGGGIDMSGVGTGAFLLDSFEPGIATTLARNPNYHKADLPHVDSCEFIGIPDATARLNALLTGEVDVITDVDIRNVAMIESSADFTVLRVPSLRHFSFDMDTTVAPFDNPDVRLALKYAIDRDDITEKVFLGEGKKGHDNPVSTIQTFYHEMPQREYSIEKAKEHLAKAGLETVTVDLSVAENAFPGAIEAAVLFKEHAAPAGITINVIQEATDGYWENVWLKKPFAGVDWFGRATVDWLFSTIYTSDAPWNTGWSNARFDELHAQARAETDVAKRTAAYAEMQEIIHNEGNMITVAFVDWRFAVSNAVGHADIGGLMPNDNMRMCERWWKTA